MNLEQNPTNPENQAELETKKKKLKDLETKQKQLDQQLPLTTQITNLEREIKQLTNKPTRTPTEEALLADKKKQLEELLKKQDNSNTTTNTKPSDKTSLYVGCGAVGLLAVLLIFILARSRRKRKLKY